MKTITNQCQFCNFVERRLEAGGDTASTACRAVAFLFGLSCTCGKREGNLPCEEDEVYEDAEIK